MGFEPMELRLLHYADTLEYGICDLDRIEVLGTPIAEIEQAFKPHETTEQQLQWREASVEKFLP